MLILCSMHQILKVMKTRWSIQLEIYSTLYKTLLGDMKDGMVTIPFNYYSRDGTCLLDFIDKCVILWYK